MRSALLQITVALAICCFTVQAQINLTQVIRSNYTGRLGLNDVAARSGKFMGTATDIFNKTEVNADSHYMKELKNKKDWGSLTAANLMKMKCLQPTKGKFNFTLADKFIAFAKRQHAKVRCHNLIWHQQLPVWIKNGTWTNETLLAVMDDHITRVVKHFGDDCYSWDVVNEAIDDVTATYVNSIWYQTIGPSFIAHAFNTADKVRKKMGLKVKFYYNDYNIEYSGWAKNAFANQMLRGLLDQGVKVDGVGLQGHFMTGKTPTKARLITVMSAFEAMGLDIAFTEFDLRITMPASIDLQQQQVTDYETVIGACLNITRCVGVTVWDFDDTYSWIPGYTSTQGWALPFLQPEGAGTALVRKGGYDGILRGWGLMLPPSNHSCVDEDSYDS